MSVPVGFGRAIALLACVAVMAALLSGCGGSNDAVVVYNAQHEELISAVAVAFTKETGIKVKLRNGSDLELANTLVAEGKASPADVFLTENSPAMALVDSKGLFTRLPAKTLDRILAAYRPEDGDWTGFIARSTVLLYNKDQLADRALPTSLMDLARPEWKGKVAFSPTGADFQAIVAGMVALEGEGATRAWLEGLKANGKVLDGNNVVLREVNAGKVQTGIAYHYYWYRDQEESGDNSDHTALHFFSAGDPGAFLSVSGAGVLADGKHTSEAKQFVDFLTSEEGQQVIADSYALEYTLNPTVTLGRGVKPLASLQAPPVAVADLDSKKVIDLMQEVGFL